jgi:hypothetical protein
VSVLPAKFLKRVRLVLIILAHVSDGPIDTRLRCPGRPAVEITRYVDTDVSTGAVKVPPESRCVVASEPGETVTLLRRRGGMYSQVLPKGKPWRDVHRYPETSEKTSG